MASSNPVQADYGMITEIGARNPLEFYVFDEEIEVSGKFNIQQKLSDGRYAVGGIDFRGLGNKIARAFRIRKGGLEIKTEPEFRLRKPLDKQTKEKIKDELLTRRCHICNTPTQYEISFVTFRIADPFSESSGGYIINPCLEHINETIEKEGRKEWYMIPKTKNLYPALQ